MITLVLANTVIVECTTHTYRHAFVFITETDCNLIKDSNTLQIEDDKCAVTITNKISTKLSNMMKNNFAT